MPQYLDLIDSLKTVCFYVLTCASSPQVELCLGDNIRVDSFLRRDTNPNTSQPYEPVPYITKPTTEEYITALKTIGQYIFECQQNFDLGSLDMGENVELDSLHVVFDNNNPVWTANITPTTFKWNNVGHTDYPETSGGTELSEPTIFFYIGG